MPRRARFFSSWLMYKRLECVMRLSSDHQFLRPSLHNITWKQDLRTSNPICQCRPQSKNIVHESWTRLNESAHGVPTTHCPCWLRRPFEIICDISFPVEQSCRFRWLCNERHLKLLLEHQDFDTQASPVGWATCHLPRFLESIMHYPPPLILTRDAVTVCDRGNEL